MYEFLLYPFDVIKTNRIVHSSLTKEGAESLPRELKVLVEFGGVRSAFRGLEATIAMAVIHQACQAQNLMT